MFSVKGLWIWSLIINYSVDHEGCVLIWCSKLFYLKGLYSEPLGLESGSVPSEAIKASSELDDKHSASRARLNTKPEGELMGAWIPLQSDENQWLQVDLGKVFEVTKVCTQGGGDGALTYVTTFILLFSDDGENFQEYQENNATKVRNSYI